jgi:type IV pilus assembly protein PilO
MAKSDSKFATFLDKKYIPLDKKVKIGITVLLVIIPAALFYFLYYQGSTEEIAKLQKNKNQLIKDIQNLREKERNKPILLQQVALVEAEFEQASAMLPKTQEIPQLLKDISALGRNAGLDFLSFAPQPEVQKDYFNEIPVAITIRGPYHSVGFFFDQVTNLDRIVSVSNIAMTSPKKVQGEMLLNSKGQLVTYRFTNKKISVEEGKGKK